MMKNLSYQHITDEKLVSQIQEGCNKALSELYSRYQLIVFNRCMTYLSDSSVAADICQDVLIKVFEKINSFKGTSKFSTWLYAITYNTCMDHLRKEKSKQFIALEPFHDLYDNCLCDDFELEESSFDPYVQMNIVLDQLSEFDKTLLKLKYEQNLSIGALQDLFQLSASAIKMRLKRARSKATAQYKISTVAAA